MSALDDGRGEPVLIMCGVVGLRSGSARRVSSEARRDRWVVGVWIVELRFTPEPRRLAARPAQRRQLAELHEAGALRMAGPLADDSGAVIVFDVPDRAALQRLLDADPYYTTPGVTIGQPRQWEPFLS